MPDYNIIRGSTLYVEIERKYKADNISTESFIKKLHGLNPYKYLQVFGPDTYYEKGDDVLRWRFNVDKSEFTIKKRHSSRNTFVRDEIDLCIQGNSPKTILKFIKALGYKKVFRLYKNCQIFWFSSDIGNVSIVIYEVTSRNNISRKFIEIEAEKGQNYKVSKQLVNQWEKLLNLKVSQRIGKSLYEIYSNKLLGKLDNLLFCSKCSKLKAFSDFYVTTRSGDHCKSCTSLRGKSAEKRAYKKRWRDRTKAERKVYMKAYRLLNKDRLSEYALKKQKERWRNDPVFKLTHTMRTRLNAAIKNRSVKKNKSTISYLGCTYGHLIKYLESMFHDNPFTKEKMTWQNWGNGPNKWQIDHIIPFIAVDLTNPEELAKVNHYSNLRPLWDEEHLIKSIQERKLGWIKKEC